jgi:hypothetical protein
VEGCELDGVAVYFADVEVGANICYFFLGDMVSCAPDAFGGFMLYRERLVRGRCDVVGGGSSSGKWEVCMEVNAHDP